MQTESISLFHGRLRGNFDTHVRDGQRDAITQVNDNAEMLIRGSYVSTPRDPFTGELAIGRVPTRIAPNGTPFLVPDVEQGLTVAYLMRRTWRLIYALAVRDIFDHTVFDAVDETIKAPWMRLVFDYVNPFWRTPAGPRREKGMGQVQTLRCPE